jgi:anti-sigma regulatory factor (Ser/Thr protein kinase)
VNFVANFVGTACAARGIGSSTAESEIGRVLEALENFGAEHGISPRHIHELDLALEEHLTNIITHTFQTQAEHEIVVRGELTGHMLRIEIAVQSSGASGKRSGD